MKRTISAMVGKGSLNHNCRKFHAENTDPARSHLNIEYYNDDIQKVYHELFDEALQRYNNRQTRKDRRIDNYYKKISSGKQEKPFHEIIIQIGNREDCNSTSADGILAAKILDEYMKEFQSRNTTLRVFSAHLHMDEATPHLHIDFIPFTTGSKRGLDTRVSLKQALSGLGFKGGTRSETEWNQWANSEKEQLASIMERHGIEWEKKGTHNEHLSVLDFKKKERSKEVQKLEERSQDLIDRNEYYKKVGKQMKEQLSEMNDQVGKALEKQRDAEAAAEKAEKERIKEEKKTNRIQKYISAYEKDVWEYDYSRKWQLPEAGTLMTGKAYRDKKAVPLVDKLKNVIRNLTIRLLQAEGEIKRLGKLLERKEDKICRLENRIDNLSDQVSQYHNRSEALDYVERAIGKKEMEQIIRKEKEKERECIPKKQRINYPML